MEHEKNTLESLLAEILRREKNSLEIIEKLEEVYTSDSNQVTIQYVLEDGTEDQIQVPSHGFLLQEIERINNNIQSITGLSELDRANVKLPDGTIKTIITSEPPVEPDEVRSVGKPLFFHKKDNKFTDKFLNPLPFVKFDLTDKISLSTKQVMIKKVLLNTNTPQEVDFFNTNINGVAIEYADLINALEENGISKTEFDEVVDLPPRRPRYSGKFDVQNKFNRTITEITDNTELEKDVIIYKLDTILYKDLTENGEVDVQLKRGDELLVLPEKDTKYRVETVDATRNEITVKRIEGYRNIKTSAESLSISPGVSGKTELEVTINVDERMVVFFKPLNPNLNVVNFDWGEGTGFYTNELVDFDDEVDNTQLPQFYSDFISDAGKNVDALAKENFIPLQDAVKPDAPELNTEDFRVVQINTHKEDNKAIDNLKKKFAEKNKVKKNIDKLDASIEKQKTIIATSDFKNQKERRNAEKELQDLIDRRSTSVNEFNTLVNDIIARTREGNEFSPKYRVRGFFPIPEPKFIDEENQVGKQDVVQFIVQYRYLKKDNTTPESESFEFTENVPLPEVEEDQSVNQEKKKATFSKWNQIETVRRDKQVEESDKIIPTSEDENNKVTVRTVTVQEEDPNNPDEVNSNQIDIPISNNENVEIRIKSVSEAGYPHMKSDWSDPIIIEFPEELIDDTEFIGDQAQQEQLRASFLQELNSLGLNEHLSDSIEVGGDTFAHSARNIATSFKTDENKPIDVDKILIDYRNEIDQLKSLLSDELSDMTISITDEVGNEIAEVSNNDTINIFAGYYKELVESATIKKGEIVSKLYYIEIGNLSDKALELLSYVPGLPSERAPDENYDGYLHDTDQYREYRKYWKVPMSLRSVTLDNDTFQDHHKDLDEPFIEIPPFQSSQVKGQFIYSRRRDITLNNKLYVDTGGNSDVFVPTQILVTPDPQPFVWDESETTGATPNGGGNLTNFCVHIDHPELQPGSELMSNFSDFFDPSTKLPIYTRSGNKVNYPFFAHSKGFNLQANDVDGLKQLEYVRYEEVLDSDPMSATAENFPRKIGFSKNDKYLIGKNTCGSYLFLAPADNTSLHSGSQIFNEGKVIRKGDSNALRVPFIFQMRMTDYHGAGSSGTGILGGYGSPQDISNLIYSKKLGFDLVVKDKSIFSFDIKVEGQYKPRSVGDVSLRQVSTPTTI